MGRKTHSPTFRVRFRDSGENRSVLVVNNSHKGAKEAFGGGGRILRVTKVSDQERLKVGEFFPAKKLMDELREEAKRPRPVRVETLEAEYTL